MRKATIFAALALVLTAFAAWTGRVDAADVKGTTLNVLTWGDYIDWAVPAFEEKYGVTVNLDYYNSEQEAINKLKAGRLGSVDVVFLGSGHEMQALKQGLIVPIDTAKLANFPKLYPFFQERAKDEPGGPNYKIPFDWGTNSFMYNADKVTDKIDSWAAMWDPKYKGKISLLDRAEMIYWYTALALGLDLNDGSDAAFAAIEAKVREQMPLNKTLWASGDDIIQYMLNDEVWLAHADSGRAFRLRQEGKNVVYVIPKEGAQGWFDCLCLVNKAPNPELAMLFIDYMISTPTQTGVVENVQYAPTNKETGDALSPDMKTMLMMEDVDKTLNSLKYSEFMGVNWNTRVQTMWTKLKAEAGVR